MSAHDDALGRLTEGLAAALAAGEEVDDAAWAARFAVEAPDVAACRRALQALGQALGEEAACGHPELPRPALPGYTIEAELGRGGMGVVYRAQQDKLGRPVAIKVLRPGDLVFGDALARFRSEAKSLARLRHRHIVSIHDVGETKDGLVWFAMDLIEGETLAAEIARRGPLLPARAVRILRQVTSAIAHAHAQGVVHRDLKPHNVLIDRNGDAYVVDFGLAHDAASLSVHTVAGQLLGTPQYMSPEQARGDVAAIGEASDVWALGALLYECLGGRGPFAGLPLHETIRAILEDEPRPLRQVDARVPMPLAAVAGKALQKRPMDRYGSALAFGEELERFAQGEPVLAKPVGRAQLWGRRAWRQRRSLAAAAAAVAGVVAWFLVFVLPGMQREATLAAAERSRAEGFPGAALAPLREALAEVAAGSPDATRIALGLVRALVERACELDLAGKGADAAILAEEAWTLIQATKVGGMWAGEEWQWESCRAAVFRAPEQQREDDVTVPLAARANLLADLRSDAPCTRAVALRLAVHQPWPDLGELDDIVLVPLLRAAHEQGARALAAGRPFGFPMPPMLLAEQLPHLAGIARPARVGALVDPLAARAGDAAYHACVLRTLFAVHGLPVEHWDDLGVPPRWPQPAVLCEEARDWAQLLARAANAPPDEGVQLVVARLRDELRRGPDALQPTLPRATELAARWLGEEVAGRGRAGLAARCEERLQRSADAWLGEVLGAEASLRATPAELLTRVCREARPARAMALWQLLRRSAPRVDCAPVGPPPTARALPAWRRVWSAVVGSEDARSCDVQLVVLHFADGALEPAVIGAATTTARVGHEFELVARVRAVPTMLALTERRLFAARELHPKSTRLGVHQRPGEVGVVVSGLLREDAEGPFLGLEARDFLWYGLLANLPGRVSHGHSGGVGPRLRLHHAGGLGIHSVVWAGGAHLAQFVVLLRLLPVADDAPGDVQSCRADLLTQLRETPGAGESLRQRDWLTPSLWPFPEALPALQAHLERFPSMAAWALPLAGAATRPAWPETWQDGGATLVRLATAPSAAAHREAALAELARTPEVLVPGVAATLAAAHDEGRVVVPGELLGTVRTIAARGGPIDWSGLLALAFVVVTLAGFVWRLLGRRRAGTAAVIALIGSCRLVFAEVEVAGVLLTPLPLALLGVLGGLLLAPLHRGWLWRGTVAFTTVLLLLTAWLRDDVVMHEVFRLRDYALDGWLLVLVLLVLLRSLVHDSARRVTRRNRAAMSPAR